MAIIYSAKTVLRYLKDHHGIEMSRDTLWRLSLRTDSRQFPIEHRVLGFQVQITADTEKVDEWVRTAPQPARKDAV